MCFINIKKHIEMKQWILSCLCALVTLVNLNAQTDVEYTRKGKFLIESNGGFVSNIFGGNTGIGLIFSSGETVANVGIDCGKFTGKNFAIKGALSVLTGGTSPIISLSVGCKYYAGGSFIINPAIGILSADEDNFAFASLHLGYAVKLANNIYLEPAIGLRSGFEIGQGGILDFKLPFTLLF